MIKIVGNAWTLLSWIRTSLAIVAGDVALATVDKNHAYIGVIILLLGALSAPIGYRRYRTADLAICKQQLPSSGYGPRLEVIGIVGGLSSLATDNSSLGK
jgi:uncharacterized membrane protein YidH (DUF202 family)